MLPEAIGRKLGKPGFESSSISCRGSLPLCEIAGQLEKGG